MPLKPGDKVTIITDKTKHGGDAAHYLRIGTEAVVVFESKPMKPGRPYKYLVESYGRDFVSWDGRHSDTPDKKHRQYVHAYDVRFVPIFQNPTTLALRSKDLPNI